MWGEMPFRPHSVSYFSDICQFLKLHCRWKVLFGRPLESGTTEAPRHKGKEEKEQSFVQCQVRRTPLESLLLTLKQHWFRQNIRQTNSPSRFVPARRRATSLSALCIHRRTVISGNKI